MTRKLIAALLLAGAPLSPAFAQDGGAYTFSLDLSSEAFAGARSRDVLAVQILLDRSRHSPGVIDGLSGGNTERAIRAYQRANGLEVTGELSQGLLDRLADAHPGDLVRRHTLTEEEVSGPFVSVPDGFEAMAELDRLAYERPSEKIAEKYHMDEDFLRALNPDADFGRAGTEILIVQPGDEQIGQPVERIEIDKAARAVRAYAGDGTLLATYPATVGSSTFPSPSGSMTVNAVAPDATYHFNPSGRSWGPDRQITIAAGPNNPVGGIWIDLSKDGYGIHGSPAPQLIGKTASHGCVRLTNWDARELAQAVSQGTAVHFV
ncbi:L,D-transpeptidase [Sphingosinicella sp. YJ22]|uniref:L,D-transpeptidase family protein n=1 Tax=Sphingosinicella sp. YJ22 TaxID=1104780 RepID=UPI001FB00458|nr:L,D-transpeptidase [Sphingosinicella sp. YJ22]